MKYFPEGVLILRIALNCPQKYPLVGEESLCTSLLSPMCMVLSILHYPN